MVVTNCKVCPAGFGIGDGETGAETCKLCPAGYSQDGKTNRGVCSPCSLGTFRSNDIDGKHCQLCPAGTYANASGAEICNLCPLGHQCEKGASKPAPCPSGTYSPRPGRSSCTPCPEGSYQPEFGSTQCLKCRAPLLALGPYTSNPCLCQNGFRLGKAEVTGGTSSECSACGSELDCEWRKYYTAGENERGLDFQLAAIRNRSCHQRIPDTLPGYVSQASCAAEFSNEDVSMEVYVCRSPKGHILKDVCPGGRPGTCAENHEGPSCSSCKEGWHLNGKGQCKKCEGRFVKHAIV